MSATAGAYACTHAFIIKLEELPRQLAQAMQQHCRSFATASLGRERMPPALTCIDPVLVMPSESTQASYTELHLVSQLASVHGDSPLGSLEP